MRADFAFVCDYAEISKKINALGIGFDTIFSEKMPCQHPFFFFVFQMRANVVEEGEKNLEIRLIDEDGKDVIPNLKGKITVGKPQTGTESIVRVATQLNNVTFPRYGVYSIHAVVDGTEMMSVSFKVSPQVNPAGPWPPPSSV